MTDHRLPQQPYRLADLTWTELDGRAPVLLVPLGSCEQHGPHLPLRTDTIIASAIADRATAALVGLGIDTLAAPPVEVTASGEHQGFPGTLSIGTGATETLLVELARSADWSGGLVLVNGHGGNHDAVTGAVVVATGEGRRMHAWWPPSPPPVPTPPVPTPPVPPPAPRRDPGPTPAPDLHAGHIETSILLALDPTLVSADPSEIAPVTLDRRDLGRLRAEGVAPVSPTGVLGDPRTASATAGIAILDSWVDDLVGSVQRWLTP